MLDPRIPIYRQAAHAMKSGRFRLDLPLGGDDEVARLGRALQELGLTLERKFGEVRQLLKVTEEINAGLLLDEVLDHVYDSFRPIIPYDRIGFSLLEETDAGTVARARWARSDTHDIRLPQGYQVALQESSLRHIIESGQPRILNDLIAYLDAHPDSDATRKIVAEGMRSSLTCPLVTSGKPVGFMFFSSKQPSTYRDVHVEIYLQIAGQLAAIVEKGRLYQRLLELDRLKNKFLGIAAHDLRSPIATVKGYISILLGDMFGPVNDQQRELMGKMDAACEKMLLLINELLDVSVIESGNLPLKMQETDLVSYLRECHEANEMLARNKSIELHLEMEPDLPRVLLDPIRMRQVLDNLISNGIKFSYSGTRMTLGARSGPGSVEIFVSDQGQGIAEDELPRLFTDFGRLSVRPTAGEKSTGLGLAIVRRIVQAHGGRIAAQSRCGHGTTIGVHLPLARS